MDADRLAHAKAHPPRFLARVEACRGRIQECDGEGLAAMLNDGSELLIIDVRERHEFEAGHIEGAVHLSKGVLERDIESLVGTVDARLVLYCGGGFRSAIAAASLVDMGYTQVWSVWGGWRAIKAVGLAE
jgi:rhodanese-related sulfurtransferase